MFPYGEQVILHRRATVGVDSDNNDVYDWTDHPIPRCAYWPAGSVEVVQGQQTVTSTDSVAVPREELPAGITAILPTDELTARGVRRQINGKPEDFGPNPFTGRQVPITVRLKEVTG